MRQKGEKVLLKGYKRIHFVGIGGAGMSAIATVLVAMNFDVSGSDISQSEATRKLEKLGAKVFLGHRSENIQGVDAIVVSTAIPESNPEVKAAREKGIKVFHRADIVAAIMTKQLGIAVAGAHGKTTTTSMVALMLEKAGLDPTVLIGGELDYLGGNAKYGAGQYVVAEADESDGSFLKLSPHIAVVTNIENDHMDFYETMENILHTFKDFLNKLPQDDGLAVLCFDNAYVRDIAALLDRPYVSYALNNEADYRARNIRTQGSVTLYEVYRKDKLLGTITMNVPGQHNVANSLAAVAIGVHLGLSFEQIASGLEVFFGAKRRFQTKGRVNGVWVVDDYAHHPTEITTTLLAAKDMRPQRLVCVFQPHRYSRTKFLRDEFGRAFKPADVLILTDVYPAGEQPIPGISGEVIKEAVERQTDQQVTYIPDKNNIARYLAQIVEPGDLVMTMGAGNIYLTGEELVEKLAQER